MALEPAAQHRSELQLTAREARGLVACPICQAARGEACDGSGRPPGINRGATPANHRARTEEARAVARDLRARHGELPPFPPFDMGDGRP